MKWYVIVDGDIDSVHKTRRQARKAAAWWRNHPAVQDRRAHGTGGRVSVETDDCLRCPRGYSCEPE